MTPKEIEVGSVVCVSLRRARPGLAGFLEINVAAKKETKKSQVQIRPVRNQTQSCVTIFSWRDFSTQTQRFGSSISLSYVQKIDGFPAKCLAELADVYMEAIRNGSFGNSGK